MSCSIIRNKENNNIKEVLAPNGQPSVLFQSINEKIKDKEDALNRWLIAYTPTFKNTFGDWESFAKAKSLFDTNIKGLYKSVANSSPEQFLFEIAIQANSSPSERLGAENAVGKEIMIEALNLFPDVKVGDTFNNPIKLQLDVNDEPLLTDSVIQFLEKLNSQVDFTLKSLDILQSNIAKQVFEKGKKNGWDLNKILTELQIPKEQKQLILDSRLTNLDDIITDLAANYSYTVEINTAKNKISKSAFQDDFFYENNTSEQIEGNNTQHYSNLTVPGGTNYTENEIATPAITPSIKGHAQFATDNGIGWFRSDDKSFKIMGWQKDDVDWMDSESAVVNVIEPNDKIIFGHPTIGKTFLKKSGNNDFISLDDDYSQEIANFINKNKGNLDKYQYQENKPKEFIDFTLALYDRVKIDAKKQNKKLFTSNSIILENRMSDFDKVINLDSEEFFKRIAERNTTYDVKAWKSQIDALISKVNSDKVITTKGYLSDLINPQVKTRRILEVQSDIFQKGRDIKSPDEIINELKKSGELQIKCD